MTKFYSTVDLEYAGNFYKDKIPEGAIPRVSQVVPEFFSGVELPQNSQSSLANLDNEITGLRKAGNFKRSKRVIIQKAYGTIIQGMPKINTAEVYTEYRGVIDSSSVGERADFNMLPSDIDVFDKEFPFERVTLVSPYSLFLVGFTTPPKR